MTIVGIPHLRINAYGVYSNTVVSVAFRGYGVPQVAWAYESQMDEIAERLGVDPLELRLKNVLKRGETFIDGDRPVDCDYQDGLRKAARAIGWSEPTTAPRRGRGIACTIKAPLAPSVSAAMVRMQLLNPSLIDYRVPGMNDLPAEYRSILVENGDGPGPYGAKGIGESGLLPTAPAIANAIARAVGVRIRDLPLTPERVWRAIDARRRDAGEGANAR